MARDFYDVLGVGRNADQSEIHRAYRKLARQHHPDVNKDPSAETRFKEISEAYDVLSDPELRKRYDAFGEDFRRVPPDVDPEAWRRARAYAGAGAGGPAGGPGGSGPRGPWPGGGDVRFDDIGEDVDLDDLLGSIFGGRPRRTAWGPMPGSDQEVEAEITVEEAYHGTQRSLTITGPDGQRTLDVNIPAGVTDGQRIRLRGQGGRGMGGGEPGDLYLIIRIAPHPRYRVSGRDLYAPLSLSPWEAALGAAVRVDTPGGSAKVNVPAGTSTGRRLRLKGRGLPNRRGEPGDFYAEAQIRVPSSLTDEERRLFRELRERSSFDQRRQR
jgi:curved DNA-binding protein